MSGWKNIQFLVPPLSFDIFRFHVLLPSSVPFIPGQDRLVICGLGDQSWSLSQAVEMRRENSVQGNHQMVGSVCLKKAKVVGKVVEYKYQVLPQTGESWYEKIRPQHYRRDGIWNRVLVVPESYKDKSFEKYDDALKKKLKTYQGPTKDLDP